MVGEHRERSLVIGAGEIGKAIHKVLRSYRADVYIRDIDPTDAKGIDVLHIAIPYTPNFHTQVTDYIEEYSPTLVFVYSTVPIGTCEKIGKHIVHSPIEGRHPHLAQSIYQGTRWLGAEDPIALEMAIQFWVPYAPRVRTLRSSEFTETLKIRSTAKYGINLVWTDYERKLANLVGLDFDSIKQFDMDYNELYKQLELPQFSRYILDPPNGTIGGHCVVSNAELLDEQYPDDLLKLIIKMKGDSHEDKNSKLSV